MSFGRLQAALAAATSEVTVAAANINFDFTLVKYEAPKEYQPIGLLLSQKRRHDAESGTSHVTARRLGALFEGECPSTPNLVAAYGKRASEIADSSSEDSKEHSKSIFAAYLGVDATSIWAAATSSTVALHVHLLGCMLARAFEAPEAISIWVELVQERRRNIAERLERGESLPFSLAAAAVQQDIPRQQLAEWDSSTRAWLQTADRIKEYEQTQLRLVLKNCNFAVNGTVVFSSVIGAWKSSLEAMEQLVSGVPQAVHDGAVIVGLSAWHLYPDMAVFGSTNVEILMKDKLIKAGGVLTLGLSPSTTKPLPGVYWSLSLSSMRHYGPPVHSVGELGYDPKRMSVPQFRQAILGGVLGAWRIPTDDTTACIKVLFELSKLFQAPSHPTDEDGWMDIIMQSSSAYLSATGYEKEMITRLINLGRRRSQDFMPRSSDEFALFSLLTSQVLLRCLENSEARISLLRRVAMRIPGLSDKCSILRYHEEEWHPIASNDAFATEHALFWRANFATVFPQFPAFLPHAASTNPEVNEASHHRWLADQNDSIIAAEEQVHIHEVPPIFGGTKTFVTSRGVTLYFLFGDPDTAAIYADCDSSSWDDDNSPNVTYDDILWCLETGILSVDKLVDHIMRKLSSVYGTLVDLIPVSVVYSSLNDATISVISLTRPPGGAKIFTYWNIDERPREFALGLVAYFEGGHDIDPSQLDGIIALSAGDSIYVPKKLVSDPAENSQDYALIRMLGNVGKPGVVILLSPKGDLMARSIDLDLGRVCGQENFDGKAEDCFTSTSLHLSFTNYHVPFFEPDSRGQQDVQLSMLEAVVSIRDSGTWVADVDILTALESALIRKARPRSQCHHPKGSAPPKPMVSVSCWEDVLDYPDTTVVVKAKGNWVARLGIIALLVQNKKRSPERVVICPADVCWQCVGQSYPPFTVYVQ